MKKNILFDLDGTLIDSRTGIIKCIEYTLKKMNFSISTELNLSKYIGPPLQVCFREILETEDTRLVDKAISFYRERYKKKGLYENVIYEGINELLINLFQNNYLLFVATSKPQVFAQKILDHLNLSQYFVDIYGSELNGTRKDKTDLIAYLLCNEDLVQEETIMIGDRKYDIVGASSNKLESIGVLWGYGNIGELTSARATQICAKVCQIKSLIA